MYSLFTDHNILIDGFWSYGHFFSTSITFAALPLNSGLLQLTWLLWSSVLYIWCISVRISRYSVRRKSIYHFRIHTHTIVTKVKIPWWGDTWYAWLITYDDVKQTTQGLVSMSSVLLGKYHDKWNIDASRANKIGFVFSLKLSSSILWLRN